MSLYDTLRKSLTPELFTQVTDALGDDFDYDVVPRSRLNKVIKQRNDLRNQFAGSPQPSAAAAVEVLARMKTIPMTFPTRVKVRVLRSSTKRNFVRSTRKHKTTLLRQSRFSTQRWISCAPQTSLILS